MKSNQLKKQLIKNAFYQGLSGIIAKIGGLIFTIIIARMLYPEAFGIYSLTLTIILTIVTISDLGIGTAITRYIAESLDKKNKIQARKEARSRFLFLFKFKAISSLILAILLFFLAVIIATLFKKPELILPLKIGSIYLLVISLYGIISPLFLATQKVKYSAIAELIFEVSRIVLVFILLYSYKNVSSIFIALSISLILALVFSFIMIKRKYNFLIKGKTQPVERKRLLLFSGFLALNSLNVVIFTNIDKLMLGYFIDAKFIGFYTAIFTVISGVLGLTGFSGVFFPVFVNLKGDRLKKIFKKTFHYFSLIAFPSTIGLAFIFLPLLRILYGSSYTPSEQIFTLVITSILLSFLILEGILTGIYTMLFNAKEKPKWPALIMFIAALINVFLNFIFISYLIKIKPEYGLIGAALATFISRYFNLIFLASMCKKKFNISPNKESIFKPLFASLLMLVFLFIFSYFVRINILTGIIMLLLAASFYFIFIVIFKSIKKDDLNILKLLRS
jgi:stage V sporulation protein B